MYRPWVSRRSRASCLLSSMSTTQSPTLVSSAQPLQAHAVRFEPGTDLLPGLMQAAASTGASSFCVLTAVGSLEKVSLRMASASRLDDRQPPPETLYMNLEERVEIVSLVGTFSKEGSKHLHMVRQMNASVLLPYMYAIQCSILASAMFCRSSVSLKTRRYRRGWPSHERYCFHHGKGWLEICHVVVGGMGTTL